MGGSPDDVGALTQIVDHGPSTGRYDIVLVAEGFTDGQQQLFHDRAAEFANTLFQHTPFSSIEVELAVNIWRLDVVSQESGLDDPADCPEAPGTGAAPVTYFDATRCAEGVQRAIDLNWDLVHLTVDGKVADWNVILVIINSDLSAGSSPLGTEIAALTTGGNWLHRALHELGHAAFNLGDEYETPTGCKNDPPDSYSYTGAEPMRPNITTNSDLATIEWAKWLTPNAAVWHNPNCTKCNPSRNPLPAGTVGAYEGAFEHHCGIFRPTFDCRMRHRGQEFCPVCAEWIVDTLLVFTSFQTWPADNVPDATVDPWSPMLAWTPGATESAWELQITDQPDFTGTPIITTTQLTVQFGQTVAVADAEIGVLKPDTEYRWRVRKVMHSGTAAWTRARTFLTTAKKTKLLAPQSVDRFGAQYPWGLEFSWIGVDGAENYEIEITDSMITDPSTNQPVPDWSNLIFPVVETKPAEPGSPAETSMALNVKMKSTLWWRVRAVPLEGVTYAGVPSDPLQVITTWPGVTISNPPDGKTAYPWPVRLEWNEVKNADKYAVDINRKKDQFGLESVQKPLNNLPPDTLHVDLNMNPRRTADNETHEWRVRVWGPEPLYEEGQNSGWYTFINDGDQTAPGKYVQFDVDPGQTWVQWQAHDDGAGVYWDATMQWGFVVGATEYDLTLQPWASLNGPPGSDALILPIEVKDDNEHDWQATVRTDKDKPAPPPSIGVLGYSWDVYAKGPEDLTGLSNSEVFGGQTADPIQPDVPTLVKPANGATGIDPAALGFSFTSQYTPSGKYKVQIEGLLPGGAVHTATISGNPGGQTNFSLAAFGFTESDLGPETTFQWRARAYAEEPDLDASYAWGPTWWFTTQIAAPPVLYFEEGHCPQLPVIFDREVLVPGATQYDYEYQQVPVGTPPQDAATVAPLGDLMTQSWPQNEFQNQTSIYENLTGVSLPGNEVALPLPGTICDQPNYAYRGHYRVWKGDNVSKFSHWWIFWDLSGSG